MMVEHGNGRWARVGLGIGAALVSAGCAPEASTEGAETARLLNEAFCDHAVAEGCAPRAIDREGCLAYQIFTSRGRDVDEGLARWDLEAVQACLDGMTCSRTPPVCDRVTIGLGAEGSACAYAGDCAPELHCAGAAFGLGMVTCGVCAPRAALGEPCNGGDCLQPDDDATSADCRIDDDGSSACRLTMRREVDDGEPCGVVLDAERAGWVNRLCAPTAVCTEGLDGVARCQSEPASLGAPCRMGFDLCVEGAFCGGGLCIPAPALGEPCAMTGMLSFACDEAAGLVCVGGVCVARPDEVGDACSFLSGCVSGLVCNLGGLCQVPGPEGAPCDFSGACASGRCIEGRCTNHTC